MRKLSRSADQRTAGGCFSRGRRLQSPFTADTDMAVHNILVLAALFCVALGALPREKKLSFLKECEEKHKTGLNIEEILDKWLIPESKEGQCLMECFVLKKGLINDKAEIDHKTATPHFMESFPGDQESVDKAERALAECDKLDLSKLDHCTRAVEVLKCFRLNAKKLNLKH